MKPFTAPLAAATLVASAAAGPVVAVYDIEGFLSETGRLEPGLLSLDFQTERPLTFFDVAISLNQAAADDTVNAIVFDASDAAFDLPQLQEIRRHLLAARHAGKQVWVYADTFTTSSALLGSAANRFVLNPEAEVDFNGLHTESLYFKGLFDKAGIEADVIHIGDFKSFGENFYRTGPSEFAAQQEDQIVSDVFEQIVADIAGGRNLENQIVLDLIDRGDFSAQEAREAGLVDDLAYRTGFNRKLREFHPEAEFQHDYGLPNLDGPDVNSVFDVFKLMMMSGKDSKEGPDYVAVVALEDAISNETIAPVRDEILKLLHDERARALVLRVSSPGGSALASEILWEATRGWTDTGRPFAVSMGRLAASGGYYISTHADRIFAEPSTITGSIGVVGMKFVLTGALEKLGITTHSTGRGRFAGLMSPTRPFTPEQEEIIRNSMLEVYATFKKRVQDGRGDRLTGELESLAGGRVYSGTRALELGLVDEIGGLAAAISWAAGEAGLENPEARLLPEPASPLEGLFSKPAPEDNGEILRMNASPPAASLELNLSRHPAWSNLPPSLRRVIQRALTQIAAAKDTPVHLLGPDLDFHR